MSQKTKSSSQTSPGSSKGRAYKRLKHLPPRFRPDAHENVDERHSSTGRSSTTSQEFAMGDLLEALPSPGEEQPQQPKYQVNQQDAVLIDNPTGHHQVPVETYAVASMPPLSNEPVAVVAPKIIRTQPDPDADIYPQAQPPMHHDVYVDQQYHSEVPVEQQQQLSVETTDVPPNVHQSAVHLFQYDGGYHYPQYQPMPYHGQPQPSPFYPPMYQPQPYMYMPVPAVPVPSVPYGAPAQMSPTLGPSMQMPSAPQAPVPQSQVQGPQAPVPGSMPPAAGYWFYYPEQQQQQQYQQHHQPAPQPTPCACTHTGQQGSPSTSYSTVQNPAATAGFSTPATQAPRQIWNTGHKESAKRNLFEAAKAMAKDLSAKLNIPESPEASSPSRSDKTASPKCPSPTSFQVLDYNQTTVLAFAYELDPNMDSDVHNCHQLAMHINVHPFVIKRWFDNRRRTSSLMKTNSRKTR